jgi:hypothetical protein
LLNAALRHFSLFYDQNLRYSAPFTALSGVPMKKAALALSLFIFSSSFAQDFCIGVGHSNVELAGGVIRAACSDGQTGPYVESGYSRSSEKQQRENEETLAGLEKFTAPKDYTLVPSFQGRYLFESQGDPSGQYVIVGREGGTGESCEPTQPKSKWLNWLDSGPNGATYMIDYGNGGTDLPLVQMDNPTCGDTSQFTQFMKSKGYRSITKINSKDEDSELRVQDGYITISEWLIFQKM